MKKRRTIVILSTVFVWLSAIYLFYSQEKWETDVPITHREGRSLSPNDDSSEGVDLGTNIKTDLGTPAAHLECEFFGPRHDEFVSVRLRANSKTKASSEYYGMSELTEQVSSQLPNLSDKGQDVAPVKFDFESFGSSGNTIDRYLFQAMVDAGVTPATTTNDYEFIRRSSLDLTGRIPTMDRVLSFAANSSPNKRAQLVEELLNKPEWIDKWTMYFGDLLKNDSNNTQVTRYAQGVTAFNNWIRSSLAANKPYDQMARELIAAQGTNSFQQGEINWLVGGIVTGGPIQDIFDSQIARMAEEFLGMAHVNCVGCHDGAGHLDTLSLWGKNTTRLQFWQLSSFNSRTQEIRTPSGAMGQFYWGLAENTPQYRSDYQLNTATGNRPPRQPIGTRTTVAPVYLFSGRGPTSGENYRVALAREVTSDFQFARAAVNYIWKELFGQGIVEPPNQFDPARLDLDNPPAEPWTLQPSNPRLLNALAQDFVNSGYDLKALMRQIVNSRAYQLSSRYNGSWNPAWQNLFARKLVRRLWAEEIHDAIAQSSNIVPSYTNANYGTLSWAMQFPETRNTPLGATNPITLFLDDFLRGNREDSLRVSDGSISQALDLMNSSYVMTRVRSSGAGTTNSLLVRNLNLPDDQLVNTLFLTVLSRYPTDTEKTTALTNLRTANRSQEAENLLWSLYNKVDFIFNY